MDYTDYDEYAKTLPRDDFWGQVRRTISGRRISEEDLGVIVEAIKDGLDLTPADDLLDLMCGNGALTARLFDSCRGVVGVDRSTYLIDVATEFFHAPPKHVFVLDDVLSYVRNAPDPSRFTKALCYGSLQHLPADGVHAMLSELQARFGRIQRLYLGNLPDKARAHLYFGERFEQERRNLADPTTQIGVWWAQEDLRALAAACGWHARFSQLQPHVFNAYYRFDAVLQPDR